LIEAELFGYNRGAYSGAVADKPGLIESADGGTFCFNEIAEIPPILQAKLLRMIESKQVRRLGDVRSRQIDVRFIAMTNKHLPEMVKVGRFREDLFHRLQQLAFHLPPLRSRIEDVEPLLKHFLELSGISLAQIERKAYDEMLTHLRASRWQGNVRELRNFVGHLANLNGDFNSEAILALAIKQRNIR
jgi:transcriptional regulator with PAS, ATPase and Fis domain